MKFSIGHRLFAAVLLAILAVTATGIALMRQTLMTSFSTYAVEIELDRLQQLSSHLIEQYRRGSGWTFLPADAESRRAWIGAELFTLQERAAPAPPAPPVAPMPPVQPVQPETGPTALPPLPPLPPPVLELQPSQAPSIDVDLLALQDRITLLDASGRYLAGRVPHGEAQARRALALDGKTVGNAIGYLAVAQAARPSDAMAAAFLDRLKDSLLIVVAVSVALSAVAGMLLAAHFRAPIGRLADGARALAEGDYTTRIAVERSDELGELARRFNRMAEQLGQLEASRRQWVADSSHELRTPLSVLRAQLEAMQDGVRSATPEHLDAMLRQVLALNKLIDDLYTLAQSDTGQLDYRMHPIDAWQLCVDAASAFRPRFEAAGLHLDITAAPSAATVLADPDRLRQVLANLLENALRYTSAPGTVTLSAQAQASVAITLDDSAPGVSDAALARLGERFYRVEASRSRAHGGSGLGLALCQQIAAAHHGELSFTHAPLGGLRVTLTLPLLRA